MGIARRVLVFAFFGYMHAVLAHQTDQYGIEGQSQDLNDGIVEEDLYNVADPDKLILRSGDETQEDGSLKMDSAMPGGVACTGNCEPTKVPIPQPNLYCHGWPIVGRVFTCLGGYGQCVTYCINCGHAGSQPPINGKIPINNGNQFINGQAIIDQIQHQNQWINNQNNNQPPFYKGANNNPDTISNIGNYITNNGGTGTVPGTYVTNGAVDPNGVLIDGNGVVNGGGSYIQGGDLNGYVIDGNGVYINGGGGGGGGGGYIINGNGGYGPNGCTIANGNCNNGGNNMWPPSINKQQQQQNQVQNGISGHQSQSQSQSQIGGGGSQSQSQIQNQVGRFGDPLKQDKHAVRNNIRLRIYA